MRLALRVVLAVFASVPAAATAGAGIWATPASTPQPFEVEDRGPNSVFDGERICLAACRKETEGLVVRAPAGAGPLRVTDLEGPEGARIPASAVETFELLRAAHGHMDALVPRPALARLEHGAALLRVHVPSDAPPGLYRGAVHVGHAAVPLQLRVWPQALPAEPTFCRLAPHWSGSTPKRDLGLEAARAEFEALWRARLTPVHAFWGKRPWWHFERSMDVSPEDRWAGTDEFYGLYFERGGTLIDLDWFYAYPHGIRLKDGPDHPANAVRYLRTVYKHIQQKFKAGDRVFVQNRADEPTLGQGRPGRQHCEYARAIAWSKVIRAAVPELKVLIAEHPAPQLLQWIDIFNAPWPHARGPDARELEAMGKRLLWYSADIKSPANLHRLRASYWRAFATNLHGAWTWERYEYLPRYAPNYRAGCIYQPGLLGGLPEEVPVASLKLEAAGEGHDDLEALRLLEQWAGDRFVALSFAQHSRRRGGPATAPQATDLGPSDFAPLRRTLAFLLAHTHVHTFSFKSAEGLARTQDIEIVPGDTGFARLRPQRTCLLNDGTALEGVRAFGHAKARVEDEAIRVDIVGSPRMSGVDFTGPRVEPAREARFDVRVTPNVGVHDGLANLGLFDIYLRIDGRYGTGVNWETGEYNRTLGHWSDNGSFPGAWRAIRCELPHTIDAPRGAASVGIAIGRCGHFDTNDPLPGQPYVLHIRNVRLTSLAYCPKGVLETGPVPLPPDRPAFVWRVPDHRPPPGTSLTVQARRGDGPWQAVEPVPGLVGVARLPAGDGPASIRLTLKGGADTPYVHAVGLVTE